MNTRSISFRLVIWYTGLLTGIFVLLGVLFYFGLQHFVENEVGQMQMRRARQIADTLLTHISQTGETYVADEIEALYAPEINGRFIRFTRADGKVIYVSGPPTGNRFDPAQVPALPLNAKPETARMVKLSGKKTLLIAVVKCAAQNQTDYFVEVGTLLDPTETLLNRLFLQLVFGLPIAIVIIAVGGYLLVQRALKPVAQITRAAEQITQHNLSERLPVAHTGDELEKLSVSLNRMIARLDDAFQNSKRFVADASHELRTPLTILQGELETLLSTETRLENDVRERVGSLLEEVMRLTKIVEQLFALSRLDAGESQTEWQRFDLAELARTTADQMNLLAEEKKITITCDAHQPALIEGDRARLKQVVVNLLDNAIKYTPSNGAVQLRVKNNDGCAILEVEDNGVGVPREALPHIFERFYRVDQARSANDDSAGLGLSIVKSICNAHGAEVAAMSVPKIGSCFCVKLPLAKN